MTCTGDREIRSVPGRVGIYAIGTCTSALNTVDT